MDIKNIIRIQKEFDGLHKSTFNWDEKITDKNLEMLEYLLICLMGELGETSNLVKKILRGDHSIQDVKEELSEEIIDIFRLFANIYWNTSFH